MASIEFQYLEDGIISSTLPTRQKFQKWASSMGYDLKFVGHSEAAIVVYASADLEDYVPDHPIYFLTQVSPVDFTLDWAGPTKCAPATSSFDTEEQDYIDWHIGREFMMFLASFEPAEPEEHSSPRGELTLAVEVFINQWRARSDDLPLSPDDRRIGDALAQMVMEVAVTEDPPRPILRAAFSWFGARLTEFSENLAASAGKAAGAGFGIGLGAMTAGHLPGLANAAQRVLDLLR